MNQIPGLWVLFCGEERVCLHCAVLRVAPSTHVAESEKAPAMRRFTAGPDLVIQRRGAIYPITIITAITIIVVRLPFFFFFFFFFWRPPASITTTYLSRLGDRFHSNRG